MQAARAKITLEVPQELRAKAQRASGSGITQTVGAGLELLRGIAGIRASAPMSGQGSILAHGGRAERRSVIAVDTSTWIAFLEGDGGKDARLLDRALEDRQVVMAPAVLTEFLSDPKLPAAVARTLSDLPLMQIEPGYWQRAGGFRSKVLRKRRKARLGDALIAQSCVDHKLSLLTRDRDFVALAVAAGQNLVIR